MVAEQEDSVEIGVPGEMEGEVESRLRRCEMGNTGQRVSLHGAARPRRLQPATGQSSHVVAPLAEESSLARRVL